MGILGIFGQVFCGVFDPKSGLILENHSAPILCRRTEPKKQMLSKKLGIGLCAELVLSFQMNSMGCTGDIHS